MSGDPGRDASLANSVSEQLEGFPLASPPAREAGAAVVIILREGQRSVETLLLERTVRDDDLASGQVALPGGRVHPKDATLGDTALRECAEEVGLGVPDLAVPLRFVGIETANAFALRVGVFATSLKPVSREPRPESPREVAHVFWLPRTALDDSQRITRAIKQGSIEVDATIFEGHVLWGFTRRVLNQFFRIPHTTSRA